MKPISPISAPVAELHVWKAQLDLDRWPGGDDLPATERVRAAEIKPPGAKRRWVAARWALRGVLGRYLEREPAEIELRFGDRGKPMLAAPGHPLHFNLSHSGELALIVVASEREVGIDIEAIGAKSVGFYAEWTRGEAVAKCHGVGLWAPLPDAAVAVAAIDVGTGFAAAVALSGEKMLPWRCFVAEPG